MPDAAPRFTEIGASGLSVLGGRVYEEFLPELTADKALRAWREMSENDSITGAMLYGLLPIVLRVDWTVDLNDAPVAEGDFLTQAKDDMSHPWRDVVAEGMTMGPYGWAWLETVYKIRQGPEADPVSDYDDGRVGWRKMPLRAQETRWQWEIDDEGGIMALVQKVLGPNRLAVNTVPIPIDRSLLFRTTHHKNNPEGRSILRTGWRAYKFRKRIEELEAIGIDRDLAGLPVFYLPAEMLDPNAPDDLKAALEEFKRMGRNLRADDQACVIMPSEFDPDAHEQVYKFELASTQGRRLIDTGAVIYRWAAFQLMAIMADVMLLGHEKIGTQALSKTKAEMFTSGVQAMVDEIRDVVNAFAVPRLFRLNGIAPPWPKFMTSPVERVDPGDFVQMILELSQSGAALWPDDNLDKYVREYIGLPERTEDGAGLDHPSALPKGEGKDGPAADPKDQPAAGGDAGATT